MPDSRKTCQRCTATTKSGQRCKNRTCRGKQCWQHLKKEQGLRVKQSEIAGAGFGLFTTKPFRKNQKIANYTGENLSRAAIESRYPGNTRGEYVLCDGNMSDLTAAVLTAGKPTAVLHALQMMRVERTSGTTRGSCSVDSVLKLSRTSLLVKRFW